MVAAVFTRQCRSRARGKQEKKKKKKNSSGWKAFETKKELLRDEKNTDNAVVQPCRLYIYLWLPIFR